MAAELATELAVGVSRALVSLFVYCTQNSSSFTLECVKNSATGQFSNVGEVLFLSQKNVCYRTKYSNKIDCFSSEGKKSFAGDSSDLKFIPVLNENSETDPDFCFLNSKTKKLNCLNGLELEEKQSLYLQKKSPSIFVWNSFYCEPNDSADNAKVPFELGLTASAHTVCKNNQAEQNASFILPNAKIVTSSKNLLCFAGESIVECFTKPNNKQKLPAFQKHHVAPLVLRANIDTQLPRFEKDSKGNFFLCLETKTHLPICVNEKELLSSAEKRSKEAFPELNSLPTFDFLKYQERVHFSLQKTKFSKRATVKFLDNKLCYFESFELKPNATIQADCFESATNIDYTKLKSEKLNSDKIDSSIISTENQRELSFYAPKPWNRMFSFSNYVCAEKNSETVCLDETKPKTSEALLRFKDKRLLVPQELLNTND
jgi:hypothetical protein